MGAIMIGRPTWTQPFHVNSGFQLEIDNPNSSYMNMG